MTVIAESIKPENLDNTVREVGGGIADGPQYVADNGYLHAEFYQDSNRVVVESFGRRVAYVPHAIKYVSGNLKDTIYTVIDAPIEVKGPNVRFKRSYPDVDDQFTVEDDRLKHSILVQAYQRSPRPWLHGDIDFVVSGRLEFDADLLVRSQGITTVDTFETTEEIDITDQEGHVIFTLPPVVAYDSAFPERAQASGKYRVTQNEPGVLSFDVVVDHAWMASEDRRYPVVIDPTVIVPSNNYNINSDSGTMPRIIRLANGWIVVATYQTNGPSGYNYHYFHVSKDDGATWQQLCYINQQTYTSTAMMLTLGTGSTFYALHTANRKFYSIDASIQSNIDISTGGVQLTTGSMNTGSCACDKNGKIWAVWANGTSTSGGNINFSTSTDGGKTWSAMTNIAQSPHLWLSPKIVFKSDGVTPLIIVGMYYVANNPTSYGILSYTWSGSSFQSHSLAVPTHSPTVVVDSKDNVHVISYGGATSTTTSPYNLYYSKSTDWGVTWSVKQAITANKTNSYYYPAAAINPKTDDIYVIFSGKADGDTYANVKYMMLDARTGVWSAPQTKTNSSVGTLAYQSAFYASPDLGNANDKVRYVYNDYGNGGLLTYDTITLNTPPNASTLSKTSNFDALTSRSLQWTFNDSPDDTQTAFELAIYDCMDPTQPVWSVPKTGSTATFYLLPAGTLSNGHTYQWRVKTYDQQGAASPWSDFSTFKCSSTPQVTIVPPVTVTSDTYTFSGNYIQAQGTPQQSFQFRLWDATGTTLVKDSGNLLGISNLYTFTGLLNDTTYLIEFLGVSQDNITAYSGKQVFQVNYTLPPTPVVTAENQPVTASVTLAWTTPAAASGQPEIATNNVYRRKAGGGESDWKLVASGLTGTTYVDYQCPAGHYEYGVRGVATYGAVSEYGCATVESLFAGQWLIDELYPDTASVRFYYNNDGTEVTVADDVTYVKTFAPYLRERRTQSRSRSGQLTALYLASDGDVEAQIDRLDAMCVSDRTFLLKLSSGRIFRVRPSKLVYKSEFGVSASSVSITWQEVGGV